MGLTSSMGPMNHGDIRMKTLMHSALVLTVLWTLPAFGATLMVDPLSIDPAAFDKIQSAIDFSNNGDTIEVYPGTYAEELIIDGKIVKIVSVEGPTETKIQPGGNRLLTIKFPPAAGTAIEGFEFANASDNAIRMTAATVSIKNCIISGSTGTAIWAGAGSDVLMEGIQFTNNQNPEEGASAVAIDGSKVTLKGCTFQENTAAQGSTVEAVGNSTLITQGSFFCNNTGGEYGGAIHVTDSSLDASASFFSSNSAAHGGAIAISGTATETSLANLHLIGNTGNGHSVAIGEGIAVEITNSVLVGDAAGAFEISDEDSSSVTFQYGGIVGNGSGLAVDPSGADIPFSTGAGLLLVETEEDFLLQGPFEGDSCTPGAYEPQAGSPLIDAGDPFVSDPFGYPNLTSDIGAYGGPNALTPSVNSDADTIPDLLDNCPTDTNENQADTDEDGIGDDCDETSGVTDDTDKDGVKDEDDNCPLNYNPAQDNYDKDAQGDICDQNDDDDLVPDLQDCEPLDENIFPGNAEICDGIDNDCNELIDDGLNCEPAEEEERGEGGEGTITDEGCGIQLSHGDKATFSIQASSEALIDETGLPDVRATTTHKQDADVANQCFASLEIELWNAGLGDESCRLTVRALSPDPNSPDRLQLEGEFLATAQCPSLSNGSEALYSGPAGYALLDTNFETSSSQLCVDADIQLFLNGTLSESSGSLPDLTLQSKLFVIRGQWYSTGSVDNLCLGVEETENLAELEIGVGGGGGGCQGTSSLPIPIVVTLSLLAWATLRKTVPKPGPIK